MKSLHDINKFCAHSFSTEMQAHGRISHELHYYQLVMFEELNFGQLRIDYICDRL